MPIHDWTKVESGLFHDFHGDWIQVLKHALNAGILPPEYYALSEQKVAGGIPDVLTLEAKQDDPPPAAGGGTGLLAVRPKARIVEETGPDFYQRKQRFVAVRDARDDRLVAVVEIVSPGNKNNKNGIRSFLDKVHELLRKRIHVLLIDLHPPGRLDPRGIHAAIWEDIWGESAATPDRPLTVAAYECKDTVAAYVEPVAVGDVLPDGPLYLAPGGHVNVPLEKTYMTAWEGVPRRWRREIDPKES
jgi:hypothetical protein